MMAFARVEIGDYPTGQSDAQRSIATTEEIGDVWSLAGALRARAIIATDLGEFGKALADSTRGLTISRQLSALRFTVHSLWAIGELHRAVEDFHGAWQADQEASTLSRRTANFWLPGALAAAALDLAELGRLTEASEHVLAARRALEEGQSRVAFPQEILHAEGRILLAMNRAAEARGLAEALAALVVARRTARWELPALLLLADADFTLGNHAAAGSGFQEAAAKAETQGRLPILWRALAGLAEAQRAQGNAPAAEAAAARARGIIERLAASVPDERLRAVFLQSPRVQRVLTLAGA